MWWFVQAAAQVVKEILPCYITQAEKRKTLEYITSEAPHSEGPCLLAKLMKLKRREGDVMGRA